MSGPWNAFGQMLSIFPIVLWTVVALGFASTRDWPAAEFFGICAVTALLAQHQWGRR